jgi:hypothetical protein
LISYFTWRRQNIFTNGILPCRRPSLVLDKTSAADLYLIP